MTLLNVSKFKSIDLQNHECFSLFLLSFWVLRISPLVVAKLSNSLGYSVYCLTSTRLFTIWSVILSFGYYYWTCHSFIYSISSIFDFYLLCCSSPSSLELFWSNRVNSIIQGGHYYRFQSICKIQSLKPFCCIWKILSIK